MNAIESGDLYAKSNYDLTAELGARFRAYRIALRLTQKDISEQTGISVMSIVRFEKGKASSLSLGSFAALLRVVRRLENLMETVPEMPESLYSSSRLSQRVRRKSHEE